MKKTISLAILVGLIAIMLVGVGGFVSQAQASNSEDLTKVRFGLTPFLDYGPWLLALEKGWYEEEGIKLNVINLASDSEIAEALAGGAIDIGTQSPDSALFFYPENENLRIPLIYTLFRGFYITGRKEYKTYDEFLKETGDPQKAAELVCSQLEGKTILTEKGSVHETIVRAALDVAGLTAKDAKIVDVPSPAEGVAAFLRGSGDFYTAGLPQTLRLDSEGYPRTIPGEALGPGGVNLSGIQTTKQFYQNHKDVLVSLGKILYKAVSRIHKNPNSSLRIIVNWLNDNTGSNIGYDDAFSLITKELSWPGSPTEAWQWFYNPESKYYWKKKLNYRLNLAENLDMIPEGEVDVEKMVVSDEIEPLIRKQLLEEQKYK